ncbi:hypothetical protein F9U64_07450 [Gracilibacillus oryzae]|uniref:SAM-dependent methyltransferase n=1 Tax=Gracilibacillus oryzae TaxID=1672701 RepID=A0A7C8KSU6_9BACI|nr:class I SAM-dependent methyltransferase [Gracilibacillus oryzae]KAB8137874.1 hypothetical protein F9U64_07450 [Gracilibacillus oryzae]
MIITTAGRTNSSLTTRAKTIADTYNIQYIERNGCSINTLMEQYQDDIVITGMEKLVAMSKKSDDKLFFHPNLALIRAKRLAQLEKDPFVEISQLQEGMSILDCTLGLASDSIIASIAVGNGGTVYGLEGNPLLYLLAKEGLASFSSGNSLFDEAMRRIHVINNEHYHFLKEAETNSFDVVYFDPMFDTGVEGSNGIGSIRVHALRNTLTQETIDEAKRVAKKRIILKDHWKSDRFAQLGFTQYKRKTALFHYGVIEITT